MNTYRILFVVVLSLITFQLRAASYYVKLDAMGAENGSDWTNAYTDLQDAITAAIGGDSIFVAAGIYLPHASNRSISFTLKDGVKMYGGFVGDEPIIDAGVISSRDITNNETILSGDLNGDDSNGGDMSENSYHVFYTVCNGTTISPATLLDGFTITGGNADGGVVKHGGGIYNLADGAGICNPTFNNLNIRNNSANLGGGMYNEARNANSECSPNLSNVFFIENQVVEGGVNEPNWGGGMFNLAIDAIVVPLLSNVVFFDNNAPGSDGRGGAMANNAVVGVTSSAICSPQLILSSFCNNSAEDLGTNVYNKTDMAGAICSPVFVDVTIAGIGDDYSIYNDDTQGGTCEPAFTNTLIWTGAPFKEILNLVTANPQASHSLIQYSGGSSSWDASIGTDLGNNIDADPMFVDIDTCDLRVHEGSPVLNAGNTIDGFNIGNYQGPGIPLPIDLTLSPLNNVLLCEGEDIPVIMVTINDENVDKVTFQVSSTDSMFMHPDSIVVSTTGSTRTIDINLSNNTKGSTTIELIAENLEGEDDTVSFDITINKRPVISSVTIGTTDFVDSTFCIVVEQDTLVDGETFILDSVDNGIFNQFCDILPGSHFALLDAQGCVSDTFFVELPAIINDIPLALSADTTSFAICLGDSLPIIHFTVEDDSLEQVELSIVNFSNGQVIPTEDISIQGTGPNRTLVIVPPDTVGTATFQVHAENIFYELANVMFNITISGYPEVDTVMSMVDNSVTGTYCMFFGLVNPPTGYLEYTIDDGQTYYEQSVPICDVTAGNYHVVASVDGCLSDPFPFSVGLVTSTSNKVKIATPPNEELLVYPNPSDGEVTVELPHYINQAIVKVTNVLGNTIFKTSINGEKLLDLTGLPQGIYFVEVNDADDRMVRRFSLRR